jgi:adenylate kinase
MQKLVDAKKFDMEKGIIILDGIPRNVNQAKMLADKIEVIKLFNLLCPEEILVKRLKRRATIEGRKDDASEDTIRKRLQVYEKETRPMLDFYRSVALDIPGADTPLDVLKRVVQYL